MEDWLIEELVIRVLTVWVPRIIALSSLSLCLSVFLRRVIFDVWIPRDGNRHSSRFWWFYERLQESLRRLSATPKTFLNGNGKPNGMAVPENPQRGNHEK